MSSSESASAKGSPSAEPKERRTVPKVGRWEYNDIGPPESRRQPGGVRDKEGPSTGVKVGQEGPAASWMNGQERTPGKEARDGSRPGCAPRPIKNLEVPFVPDPLWLPGIKKRVFDYPGTRCVPRWLPRGAG